MVKASQLSYYLVLHKRKILLPKKGWRICGWNLASNCSSTLFWSVRSLNANMNTVKYLIKNNYVV